jgi:PTH2 family peptidyl-tRNA hydrolase
MDVIIRAKSDDHLPEKTKQVIVVRKLYPDGKGGLRKIRSGKIASQAAHASMIWLSRRVCEAASPPLEHIVGKMSAYPGVKYTNNFNDLGFTTEERDWLTGKFTKIVLGVDTEEELIALHQKALDAGLTSHIVTDSGLTEFDGEPTNTAIAIGPHSANRIEGLTKGLSLL